MCDYLIIGASSSAAEFLSTRLPSGVNLRSFDHPALAGLLGAARKGYFLQVAGNGCSCGLYQDHQADLREAEESVRHREAALLRKCERLGWSEAKTQRALVGAREAAARQAERSLDRSTIEAVERELTRCIRETQSDLVLVAHRLGRPEDQKFNLAAPIRVKGRPVSLDATDLPIDQPVWWTG